MDPLGLSLVFILAFISASKGQEENVSSEDKTSVMLPPCGACSALVGSFLALHSKPNMDFGQILAKTCSDLSRGESQCKSNLAQWAELLKSWRQTSGSTENLKEWLCIDQLQLCCPEHHFGRYCEPCKKVGINGKICSGNGKCKGSGTRKGNGECQCDSGFAGNDCSFLFKDKLSKFQAKSNF